MIVYKPSEEIWGGRDTHRKDPHDQYHQHRESLRSPFFRVPQRFGDGEISVYCYGAKAEYRGCAQAHVKRDPNDAHVTW